MAASDTAPDNIRPEILALVEERRAALNLLLLKIYNYYRVLIGCGLLLVYLQQAMEVRLGRLFPDEFLLLCILYIAVNAGVAVSTHFAPPKLLIRPAIVTSLILCDVLTLTVLLYFSGGVSSGIGLIILTSVAAAGILLHRKTALFIAAVASMALLYEEFYLSLSVSQLLTDYFQAGLLGCTYFATAISINVISTRLRGSEITSLTRAAELQELERINRSIVARMRTGIIVVDDSGSIKAMNPAAKELLGLSARDRLRKLPESLMQAFSDWNLDSDLRVAPFQINPGAPEVRVNFSTVSPNEKTSDIIIYLEDNTDIQLQAQHLKLASLGRLSGTIAHEIRNPLGAISHAAQLLNESQELNKGDERLTHIIVNHCKRLNGVIENVLEISRRKPPKPQRLELRAWVQGFVEDFRLSDSDCEIIVAITPTDTVVRFDPSQMTQALTNLVQNGLRYSRAHAGKAAIRIEGGIDGNTEKPYLQVIDYGPGISESNLGSLFEPFFTTEHTGTGLGLYITRELCEANQASISYTKNQPSGSVFRINFAHPDRLTS